MRFRKLNEIQNRIIRVGQVVRVKDGPSEKWRLGVFTGEISIHDGQVTHLWVSTLDSSTTTGYNAEELEVGIG